MRVAILGSDSFSGLYLANHLQAKGLKVSRFGRDWDILEPKALAKELKHANPDVIVNFIAKGRVDPSWDNPQAWFDVNVGAPCEVIKDLINFPLKAWIQISTPEVCGSGVCNELFEWNPSTPYAASKAAMEMALEAYYNTFGFPFIITRSENVYGETQHGRLIPNAMEAKLKGATLNLTSPDVRRSFIHISDVCTALEALIHRGKIGEIYNIGTQNLMRLAELVDLLEVKWRKVPGRRAEDEVYLLDSTKLKALGWFSTVPLLDGLRKTWEHKRISYNSRDLKEKSVEGPGRIER